MFRQLGQHTSRTCWTPRVSLSFPRSSRNASNNQDEKGVLDAQTNQPTTSLTKIHFWPITHHKTRPSTGKWGNAQNSSPNTKSNKERERARVKSPKDPFYAHSSTITVGLSIFLDCAVVGIGFRNRNTLNNSASAGRSTYQTRFSKNESATENVATTASI